MSKDTIYIDVEDDITAIIGKVKASKSKIVALVPPKRVGVLQSAVNLRLLARAAKQGSKKLVLISGNSALTALAASAGIPSARTLKSKPEMPEVANSSDDEGEDVIDGKELPVGDHARDGGPAEAAMAASPAIDSAIRASAVEESAAARSYPRPNTAKRSGIKVPNFDTFRKRLIAGVGALVILVGFLVWAIWFAPSAHIVVTARTIESSANPQVTISTDIATDAEEGTIKAVSQEIKREASTTFRATGSKEVGDKASGQVTIRNCYEDSITIEAGTGVSAGGNTYITKAAVTIQAGQGNFGGCASPGTSTPVVVEAQDIGEEYDMDQGSLCVAGYDCSGPRWVRATVSDAIDGGSRREVAVVTKSDIEKATERLRSENTEGMRQQLVERFGDDAVALEDTFKVDEEKVSSSPAQGAEVEDEDEEIRLTGTLVFTMLGVNKSEIGDFLDVYFEGELKEEENQRVYSNGADKANFIEVEVGEDGVCTATMTATARFGPQIDDSNVKAEARGKRYGDVQSAIEQISGVESVDVQFSPFWVRTVPNDENRITIEFNLDESSAE